MSNKKLQRRLQVGNVIAGFKDLDEMDHVRFLLPDQSKYAEIVIHINARGELELRTTHGAIIVRPSYSNSIEVRSEPTFEEPEKEES